MKCINCGEELQDGSRFCAFCGIVLSKEESDELKNNVKENFSKAERVELEKVCECKNNEPTYNKSDFWNRLEIFYKILIIAGVSVTILLMISFFLNKTFAIVCSLHQIAGIIVALLMYKGIIKIDKKWISYLVLIGAILITILNIYSYSWNDTSRKNYTSGNNNSSVNIHNNHQNETEKKTAILPFGDTEYIGKKQDEIVDLLYQKGFNNIRTNILPELEADELERKGEVFKVVVDGSEFFSKDTELSKTIAIEITYYDAKHVAVPISDKDVKTKDVEELANLFKKSGFINVSVEIKNDIDPEYSQDTFRNEISIDTEKSFTITDTFPFDANVVIISHRQMEKYKVKIDIEFIPNLLLNKYSVDVEVGYTELGTLSHGEDNNFEIWLEPGKHTITFRRCSYKRPETKVNFSIVKDTEIAYEISCYEDSIHVEQKEFIEKGTVQKDNSTASTITTEQGNEISTPVSSSYSGEYKELVEKFKNAGFKNVKTKASYEVGTGFWASLSLNYVKSVSVDGKTSFSSGDRFNKDVPIIITYKEYEFKNPNIKFTSYTVAKMIKDAESNELAAEEKYKGKYVAVKGRVDGIDDSGDFNLYPTNDSWAITGVTCELLVDEQKEAVKKLKKGQVITVKGKITYVSDILGYSMEVYSIG